MESVKPKCSQETLDRLARAREIAAQRRAEKKADAEKQKSLIEASKKKEEPAVEPPPAPTPEVHEVPEAPSAMRSIANEHRGGTPLRRAQRDSGGASHLLHEIAVKKSKKKVESSSDDDSSDDELKMRDRLRAKYEAKYKAR